MIGKSGERFSGYNKPKRTPGKKKKFAVLARANGQTRLIRFGDPTMKIQSHKPGRRKNFRPVTAVIHHHHQSVRTIWSCRAWRA